MPFYEYVCQACGRDFVLLQSVTSKAEDTVCPYCSEKKSKKQLSKFASYGSGAICGTGGFSWGGG